MSTDERFDEATVQLVARAMHRLTSGLDEARAALTALADAGLLLPPGGEMTVQWGCQPALYNSDAADLCFTKEQAYRLAKTRDGKVYRRTVDYLPNGSTVTTAWTEVPQ